MEVEQRRGPAGAQDASGCKAGKHRRPSGREPECDHWASCHDYVSSLGRSLFFSFLSSSTIIFLVYDTKATEHDTRDRM